MPKPAAKKRVFISSTSLDMAEERLALKTALAQMCDVEFVGMEDWGARSDSPVKVCLDEVGRSDLLVGIIGNRYGHVDYSSGQSVTEMEYRHAKSRGQPCLIFIRSPEIASDDERFEQFKAELKKNNVVCGFSSVSDLAVRVIIGIHNELKTGRAEATNPTAALIAALFDAPALRRLFTQLGIETSYRGEATTADNANGLLSAVESSGSTVALMEALRKAQPSIHWPGEQPQERGRKWLWWGVGVGALCAAALAGWTFLPLPMVDTWRDYFITSEGNWEAVPEKTQWEGSEWDAPADWRIVRGEAEFIKDGALLVKGTRMGVHRDLGWRSFYDFDAQFKVKFIRNGKAAWAFRTQQDKESGYIFELKNADKILYLAAYIRKNHVLKPFSLPERPVDIGPCCQPEDGFVIRATVRGKEFRFTIKLTDRQSDQVLTQGAEIAVEPFIDSDQTFKHGNAGLLQTEAETVSKFEDWCVSPPGKGCIPLSK